MTAQEDPVKVEAASLRLMEEAARPLIEKALGLISRHPFILKPKRGASAEAERAAREAGLVFYPTVRRTTLLLDEPSGLFFKVLHPIGLRKKLTFCLIDVSQSICAMLETLSAEGVKLAPLLACGRLRLGGRPFLVTRKLGGRSLYETMIKEGTKLPLNALLKALDEIIKIHRLGYWLGDAHLSDIFIDGEVVSGIIDAEGMRSNRPFRYNNLAKDLAGLNHPGLPLSDDEKEALMRRYEEGMGIRNTNKLRILLKRYTNRRWKAQA